MIPNRWVYALYQESQVHQVKLPIYYREYTKMVFLGLRGKKLLTGITISSGLGFILFGILSHLCYPLSTQMDAPGELELRC